MCFRWLSSTFHCLSRPWCDDCLSSAFHCLGAVKYQLHRMPSELPRQAHWFKPSQFEAEQQLEDTVNRDTFCFANSLRSNHPGSRRTVDHTLSAPAAGALVRPHRDRGGVLRTRPSALCEATGDLRVRDRRQLLVSPAIYPRPAAHSPAKPPRRRRLFSSARDRLKRHSGFD